MSDLRFRVNNFFDIESVLHKAGYKSVSYGDRIRCPFHDDSTPDAEVYEDGNMVYCYPESESYTPYDILVDYLGVSPATLDKKVPDSIEGNNYDYDNSYDHKNELSEIRDEFLWENIDINEALTKIVEVHDCNSIKHGEFQ